MCGVEVPPQGGILERVNGRWVVSHLACHGEGESRVIAIRFPGGSGEYYQNSQGRCEDAPCCGCCNT